MTVSVQQFRVRIGCFQPSKIKLSTVRVRRSVSSFSWQYIFWYLSLAYNMQMKSGETNIIYNSSIKNTLQETVGNTLQPGYLHGFHYLNVNKISHILNGNKRSLGYKIAAWNCGRGLVSKSGTETGKLTDIKLFIQQHNPGLMAVIESDIHGQGSAAHRTTTFTKNDIIEQLSIQGYNLYLPDTWDLYAQARLVVFVRQDIKAKMRPNPGFVKDLPSMTFEVGMGREKKSLVNFYYREWKGGISRNNSQAAQIDRFTRQTEYWRNLANENRDLVLVGDANFCSMACLNPDYPNHLKAISNLANDFYLEECLSQLIVQPTRTESQGDSILKGYIDHITTNCPQKCIDSEVVAGGSSDHLAVITTKLSREVHSKPPMVKKRSYKYFSKNDFLLEIRNTNFDEILNLSDSNEAANMFSCIFRQILDNHAPIKVFQSRKNYAPWLSDETKDEINRRNKLKIESIYSNDPNVLRTYKQLRNHIKAKLKKEKK